MGEDNLLKFRIQPALAKSETWVKILFSFVFALLRPIQRIDNIQHEVTRKNVGVRFYATYGIDAWINIVFGCKYAMSY